MALLLLRLCAMALPYYGFTLLHDYFGISCFLALLHYVELLHCTLQLCLYHALHLVIILLSYSTSVSLILLLWFALYHSFCRSHSTLLYFCSTSMCPLYYVSTLRYVTLPYSVIASIVPAQTIYFIICFLKYLNGLIPPVHRPRT